MGLHSRRHEAELKLKAAEENLVRLEDVIQAIGGPAGRPEESRPARPPAIGRFPTASARGGGGGGRRRWSCTSG